MGWWSRLKEVFVPHVTVRYSVNKETINHRVPCGIAGCELCRKFHKVISGMDEIMGDMGRMMVKLGRLFDDL